mgnify:CR=1 FL=1
MSENTREPSTSTWLQTSFFIASSGLTQGPPVRLHPGELKIAHLQTKTFRFLCCEIHGIEPLRRTEDNGIFYNLARACIDVGQLEAGNAGTFHPLKIFCDSFFVTLLLVQCHQVLGQASGGRILNPSRSESKFWPKV